MGAGIGGYQEIVSVAGADIDRTAPISAVRYQCSNTTSDMGTRCRSPYTPS